MPLKNENEALNVMDIPSSDSEDDAGTGKRVASSTDTPAQTGIRAQAPVSNSKAFESRSFWKAGAYDVSPTLKPQNAQEGELEHARVHPKFLHSNATSHKWAFGAIAELLDNAVDEERIKFAKGNIDVSFPASKVIYRFLKNEIHNGATFMKVDKIDIVKDNSPALLFQDDGGGMDPTGIRKCMSLGYSSKKSTTTIGQYGNGFKTSTMRLGADAIVFTRTNHDGRATQSVGLLSYTFLRKTGQDDVIVPMIDFDISGHWAEPIIYSSQDDWSSNLKNILEWSPFTSKEDLMLQFEDIGPHGTKVMIFNLWLNDEGIYELSFDDDDEDIRLRDEANRGGVTKVYKRTAELQSHISYRIRYSLRAYASILYLRKLTNFNIILRGKPVEQFNIADDLKYSQVVTYRPQLPIASKEVIVETTIGFIKEAPTLGVSGFNVYHKNRLIMPFWKVTPDGSSRGNGVVGVLEANFIEPAHDKQDFERSSAFVRLESRLKQMINDYWKTHCHLMGHQPPGFSAQKMQSERLVQASVAHTANTQKQMHLYQPIIVLAANPRPDLTNVKAEINRSRTSPEKDLVYVQGSNEEVISVDDLDGAESASVDQICKENIQLFMRCEEHMQKEIALKQTIASLEKELREAKNKYDQLESYVETRRKHMKEQIKKVT